MATGARPAKLRLIMPSAFDDEEIGERRVVILQHLPAGPEFRAESVSSFVEPIEAERALLE